MKHAAGSLGGEGVVRDHHDRFLEFSVELFHEVEDLTGGHAVEVAGRLVRDQQIGVGDEGRGDRHSLLLAAGELAGIVVLAPVQADDSQGGHDVFAPPAPGEMGQEERQLDVFQRGQHRDQVISLEDEADIVGPPAGDLGSRNSPRSWPWTTTSPRVARSSPAIRFKSVVLPEPEGPIRPETPRRRQQDRGRPRRGSGTRRAGILCRRRAAGSTASLPWVKNPFTYYARGR